MSYNKICAKKSVGGMHEELIEENEAILNFRKIACRITYVTINKHTVEIFQIENFISNPVT